MWIICHLVVNGDMILPELAISIFGAQLVTLSSRRLANNPTSRRCRPQRKHAHAYSYRIRPIPCNQYVSLPGKLLRIRHSHYGNVQIVHRMDDEAIDTPPLRLSTTTSIVLFVWLVEALGSAEVNKTPHQPV